MNRNSIFKVKEGAGKSGSFFFHSFDNKFLIKTIGRKEKQVLLEILDRYISHIKQSKNQSLICRYYGLFTLKTNDLFVPLDVVVMKNTSRINSENSEIMTFDLKGSTRDREIRVEYDNLWSSPFGPLKVMKDNNFVRISQKMDNLMQLSLIDYKRLCDRVKEDSEFLLSCGLIDYSLLLTIERF